MVHCGSNNYRKCENHKIAKRHHRLNRCELEQILGEGEGQGSLAGCSPWGRKESDTTEQLNNNGAL